MTGRLNWQHWAWKMLTDGHTSITVSIDYSADANAAAKWRLAGGARSKMLLFRAAGKGRGGAGIWHMIDGLSIASEACLDLWQGSACGARPPKPRAHWSICYLHPKWMGHSCGWSQWGHCRKNPDAFCHCTAVFMWWWASVSHLREILSAMKACMNNHCLSTADELNQI